MVTRILCLINISVELGEDPDMEYAMIDGAIVSVPQKATGARA